MACGRSSVQISLGAASVFSTRVRVQVDFVLLSVKELVEAESASGGHGAVGKEVARKFGGASAKGEDAWKEIDIKLVLPLLRSAKHHEHPRDQRFIMEMRLILSFQK